MRTLFADQQALAAGQAALDNAAPIDLPDEDDIQNCQAGNHAWRFIRSNGEVSLYRCSICRTEDVD